MGDSVVGEEVETVGKLRQERGGEVIVEPLVALDGIDHGAGGEKGAGKGAEAGTDLDDGIAGDDAGEREGFMDDVAVDEKILAQRPLRVMAEGGEEVPRGGGR